MFNLMEILKLVVDKLSQYNFLTNILPGTVLCVLLKYFVGLNLIPADYYQAGIVFYFAGIVNGRVGSLIIEPILKKIKFIVFAPYPDFIEAEKKDGKIMVLSQENNTFRSYISVVFVVLVAYVLKNNSFFEICHASVDAQLVLLIALLLLFLFSYRKQTKFVKKRIEQSKKNNDSLSH